MVVDCGWLVNLFAAICLVLLICLRLNCFVGVFCVFVLIYFVAYFVFVCLFTVSFTDSIGYLICLFCLVLGWFGVWWCSILCCLC